MFSSTLRLLLLSRSRFDRPWHRHLSKWTAKSRLSTLPDRYFSSTSAKFKKRKTDTEKDSEKSKQGFKNTKNKITTVGVVDIWRNMTVSDLAQKMDKNIEHIQEVMLYVKGADDIEPEARIEDLKIIREIALKCGLKTKVVAAPVVEMHETKDKDIFPQPPVPENQLKPRPPVVTVMGHVDHGKTTLLDSLRGASVAAGEAGGITQHIGAFVVKLENDEQVTFLDTPGHAAFSAMRARGAHCTDIIVLVVAADDGVMEQTKEVIQLAIDAKVPIIVAINKIDAPAADIERTKKGLIQMGLSLEGHGGDIQVVNISALNGTNLNELADALSTQATLMGLKSTDTGLVEGIVIESKHDSRRGKLSTAIISRGTLRKGSILVSGLAWAKVRGLFDHEGRMIETAPPGTPVEILGWRELPEAGDVILEVESDRKAHSVIHFRHTQKQMEKAVQDLDAIKIKEEAHNKEYQAKREARRLAGRRIKQSTRPKESAPDDPTPRVNIILKGDVHGSVEAILDVLDTYDGSDKCRLNVVHYGVGNVIEGDLELAKLFKAIIYAFSVETPQKPPKDVIIKQFNIIYRVVDDLKEEINKLLPEVEVEEILGEANVLQIFQITEGRKEVPVMGCRCTKGVLKKNARFRLMRQTELIYDGRLDSMRHLKNEVESIKKDVECGLKIQNIDVEAMPGDTLICYSTNLKPQFTDWDPGF